MNINIKLLNANSKIPSKTSADDAGYDQWRENWLKLVLQ